LKHKSIIVQFNKSVNSFISGLNIYPKLLKPIHFSATNLWRDIQSQYFWNEYIKKNLIWVSQICYTSIKSFSLTDPMRNSGVNLPRSYDDSVTQTKDLNYSSALNDRYLKKWFLRVSNLFVFTYQILIK
jgi:hypothetical protein